MEKQMTKMPSEIEKELKAKGFKLHGEEEGLEPGMYMSLYHGFVCDADHEEYGDWGACGPIIGPLETVHDTYLSDMRITFASETAADKFRNYLPFYAEDAGVDTEVPAEDSCIWFDGVGYGDYCVFIIK